MWWGRDGTGIVGRERTPMMWAEENGDDMARADGADADSAEAGMTESPGGAERPGEVSGDETRGLRDELSELNGKRLRALADLDNYRKRIERERRRWADDAREDLLLSLLDVVDDFERAVTCGEDMVSPPDDSLRQGVELILKSLLDILDKNNVRPIDTCGAEFDPAFHEAVGQVESDDHESEEIVEELRRGYMLGDRLLRCSRVIVAK